MNLSGMFHRAWRKFALFAYAMDYDERSDVAARVEELDRVQQSHSAALAAAAERIEALSGNLAAQSRQSSP